MTLDLSQFINVYKNKLLDVAQNSGIPLSSFFVDEDGSNFIIKIKDTPFEFIAQQDADDISYLDYKCTELKAGYPLSSVMPTNDFLNIDELCVSLHSWLNEVVKKYFELASIPDRWLELQSIQPFIRSSSFRESDFETFSNDEKLQVRSALLEFEGSLRDEFDIVKDDLDIIKEKLEYLGNAVDRLNRFDWKGIATSTVIGIATNLSVDVEMGKRILELFQQAFTSVIKLLR